MCETHLPYTSMRTASRRKLKSSSTISESFLSDFLLVSSSHSSMNIVHLMSVCCRVELPAELAYPSHLTVASLPWSRSRYCYKLLYCYYVMLAPVPKKEPSTSPVRHSGTDHVFSWIWCQNRINFERFDDKHYKHWSYYKVAIWIIIVIHDGSYFVNLSQLFQSRLHHHG